MIECERKFLVADLPDLAGPPTAIRQGYLAVDGAVAVRVRDAKGERTLTIKGGAGRDRTEVELSVDEEQFEALWPMTEGRRIEKDRHRIPLDGGHTAELDLFHGAHEGLRVVEVEFPPGGDPDDFEPPAWFGREVTDDGRYSNASLAVNSNRPPT